MTQPTPSLSFLTRLPSWVAPLFFGVSLGLALWRAPWAPPPAFVPPPPAATPSQPAFFHADSLPVAAPSAHAATLAQLADGRLAAAWFAGSRDGAGDVAVWFATLDAKGWSEPQAIATRESTAGSTLAYVRKLGNPVLYREGNRLHLWYVSAAVGGWAGSSINHALSEDGGLTWSPARKLVTSPFLNISTLVRTPPLPLADGGLGLPVYHEFMAKHGEWLRLGPDGRILGKERLVQPRPALQPAVAALDGQRAVALLRDAGPGPGHVQVATSADGGRTWPAGEALPLPNPNASVALLRLASGRLLLAGNPASGREALLLWLSADEGKTWRQARVVESAPDGGAEFSYPALLLDRDGRIHLAYTWRRQGIKHAVFSEAWLDGGTP